MKPSFLNQPQPVLTAIMAGPAPDELIAESRNVEFDGARGIAIDLLDLKPEFRNRDAFKRIVDAVKIVTTVNTADELAEAFRTAC